MRGGSTACGKATHAGDKLPSPEGRYSAGVSPHTLIGPAGGRGLMLCPCQGEAPQHGVSRNLWHRKKGAQRLSLLMPFINHIGTDLNVFASEQRLKE